jgi:SHS family lactate transporter-like MFS transporter
MTIGAQLKTLTKAQRSSILASYLGWTLDAFDFFLMVFMLAAIAREFGTDVKHVAHGVFLTLAARPLGAFVFGLLADRFGRRPILMIDILLFSVLEFASGFAPTLWSLLALRFLFGVAMGGEWGIGSSLVMESIPPKLRGPVSGLLQSGYPTGYLLASIVYFLLFDAIGWRGLFMVGVAPALFVIFIRMNVEESPAHEVHRAKATGGGLARLFLPLGELARSWKVALYLVLLMAAFNSLSHGTQDLYPTFLQKQHHFDTHTTGLLAIVGNIGAIVGGISFGVLSERIGRRRAIVLGALLVLPVIPLWAWAATPLLLGLGAFLVQVAVQGAWGIVPVHLNELSPGRARGTFPGFAYQLGNLAASWNVVLQTSIAESRHDDYSLALALFAAGAAIAVAVLSWFGPERRDVDFVEEARRA